VAYLVSRYPAISHTFVLREVLGLRAAGVEVATTSVRATPPEQLLAEADRQEAERTWCILPPVWPELFRAHLGAAFGRPRAYAATLAQAWRCAPGGARAHLWQLFYFIEAISFFDHVQRLGIRRLHAHLANVAADVAWLAASFGQRAYPGEGWQWSFTLHGPTELYAVERHNLPAKVAAADSVICISEFARSQLMAHAEPVHWPKLHVVHCGADLERYRAADVDRATPFTVLSVGRLVPEKGFPLLIEAFAQVARTRPDIRLVVAGGGPLEPDLRGQVERLGLAERVDFAGYVGQDDMPGYFARCHAFCLPSFAEGVPIVLMEAMATGRPVLTTRIAGIPELVQDGQTGLLVSPGSAAELTAALARLADDAELRERLGQAGRRWVEAEFDARKNAAQLADLFAQDQ
jgi:colanic acid/amylovoran biosynthesis glycosyltransferase